MATLSSKQRKNMPTEEFAIPETRSYPIGDISHARNALARSSGKPEESRIKKAVYKKFPELDPKNKKKKSAK